MKKIEAVVRAIKIHDIQEKLLEIGIPTFSIYQVQITGIHKAHAGVKNRTSDYIPKLKIEILCADKDEDKIIETIQDAGKSGEKGDGIVFSYDIGRLVKIRTAEAGEKALH
ncbi:P-II family nitrogen regulator [Nitrosopumilus sp. S6]